MFNESKNNEKIEKVEKVENELKKWAWEEN